MCVCCCAFPHMTDDHCGTLDPTCVCAHVCERVRRWTGKDSGMDTAGNVLFDRHSGCLDTHVM